MALKSDYSAFEMVPAILTPGKNSDFLGQTPARELIFPACRLAAPVSEIRLSGLGLLPTDFRWCVQQGPSLQLAFKKASFLIQAVQIAIQVK
jgi:hypothetical protein